VAWVFCQRIQIDSYNHENWMETNKITQLHIQFLSMYQQVNDYKYLLAHLLLNHLHNPRIQVQEYEAAGKFNAVSVSPVGAFAGPWTAIKFSVLLCLLKVFMLQISTISPLTYIYCCAVVQSSY
jgi:hypothetical protein